MVTTNAEKPMPFYKQVAQLSLLFCTALIMLAAATALTMEFVHGTL
jgi:hypothetical protein